MRKRSKQRGPIIGGPRLNQVAREDLRKRRGKKEPLGIPRPWKCGVCGKESTNDILSTAAPVCNHHNQQIIVRDLICDGCHSLQNYRCHYCGKVLIPGDFLIRDDAGEYTYHCEKCHGEHCRAYAEKKMVPGKSMNNDKHRIHKAKLLPG